MDVASLNYERFAETVSRTLWALERAANIRFSRDIVCLPISAGIALIA
jgi:hypothetical protein